MIALLLDSKYLAYCHIFDLDKPNLNLNSQGCDGLVHLVWMGGIHWFAQYVLLYSPHY